MAMASAAAVPASKRVAFNPRMVSSLEWVRGGRDRIGPESSRAQPRAQWNGCGLPAGSTLPKPCSPGISNLASRHSKPNLSRLPEAAVGRAALDIREVQMEQLISRLLGRYENGALSRRELV